MHANRQHEEVAAAVLEEGAFLYRNPEQGLSSWQEGAGLDVIACPQALHQTIHCLSLQPAPSPPPTSLEDSYRLLEQASPPLICSMQQPKLKYSSQCDTCGLC